MTTPRTPRLGALFAGVAKEALDRAVGGAVAGAKREFAPDGAMAALAALDKCLAAADDKQREVILGALAELAEKYT